MAASVVKWSEFLCTNPEVPGSIPSDTIVYEKLWAQYDRLCRLVGRVPGHKSRGPAFDSQRYHSL
jgi:hypothetical protein